MVKAIGSTFTVHNNESNVKKRTIDAGKKGLVVGAVIGGIEGYARKSWLNGDKLSDSFVKQVEHNLEASLTPVQHKELEHVNNFFAALVDKDTPLKELKSRITSSTELTNALPKNDGEDSKAALDRIFANPNKEQLRTELRTMQNKTVVDKKVDLRAAKKLGYNNFNKEKKVLEKAANTPEESFKLLKNAVNKIKVRTSIRDTIIGGVLVGTLGMLLGASSSDK